MSTLVPALGALLGMVAVDVGLMNSGCLYAWTLSKVFCWPRLCYDLESVKTLEIGARRHSKPALMTS